MTNENLITLIAEGPAAVELAFQGLLGTDVPKDPFSRYCSYTELAAGLPEKTRMRATFQFIDAYLSLQAGHYCSDQSERIERYKHAHFGFTTFLREPGLLRSDERYYATWQLGNLLQVLGTSWPECKAYYFKAGEYSAYRAEALREVILYYVARKEWIQAHLYTHFCAVRFFNRRPLQGWYVNKSWYAWKILKYHIHVLMKIGLVEAAREYYHRLENIFEDKSIELPLADHDEIDQLLKAWGPMILQLPNTVPYE